MNTLTATPSAPANTRNSVGNGILAGLAGGVIFGIMMQMMGIMAMLAMMMGSKSDLVGWMIHLMISAIFGLAYGLIGYKISSKWAVAGLVFGMILWVFGPLFMMPVMAGMTPFAFDSNTWISLMGHMIYGLITAWTFSRLTR